MRRGKKAKYGNTCNVQVVLWLSFTYYKYILSTPSDYLHSVYMYNGYWTSLPVRIRFFTNKSFLHRRLSVYIKRHGMIKNIEFWQFHRLYLPFTRRIQRWIFMPCWGLDRSNSSNGQCHLHYLFGDFTTTYMTYIGLDPNIYTIIYIYYYIVYPGTQPHIRVMYMTCSTHCIHMYIHEASHVTHIHTWTFTYMYYIRLDP